ncbi:pilus assembly protein [Sulfitobacter sp. F26169L]|uniref:TadE/TadG family type IV pilus assembly protein n=1 Tax=Sulfitobacter sp. F26169L TaxID=2996015 RepID=UPI002260EF30|nr:TadE/TadG family type IV pilus assembly protein [Sulfitobacter sp. F26169L]MCX7565073.1 pilus assembly protein [Sulfitobacter sp. F26169L]
MALNPLRHIASFRRGQSGAVAVEFVLIAPLLFALVFGIIVTGYFIGVSHSVAQLASDAARASVAGLDMRERRELATDYLAQASTTYPLLVQSSITPEIVTSSSNPPAMTVNVTYTVDGTILDVANSLLRMNIADIRESAYIAY